ncbi:MAG: hypothetical protein V4537_08615 [Pseudomonadota bacterium]
MNTRYLGKPLLRLVDSYVLDAIGHLPPEVDAKMTEMEPKFRDAFGATGSWREIVVDQMKFPAGLQGAIREVWDKGRVKFLADQGFEPDPGEFTQTFVDTNFAR